MRQADVQYKVIDKILPYKMKFEECWKCGGKTFFVVFNSYRQVKPEFGPKGFDLATDVDFFCAKCSQMSGGVAFNEDLVNMKGRKKKMKLEDVMTPEEARRLSKALKKVQLPAFVV